MQGLPRGAGRSAVGERHAGGCKQQIVQAVGTVNCHALRHSRAPASSHQHHQHAAIARRGAHLVAAAAATAVTTRAASTFSDVPRGETAGAALIMDGVTIQAGDRDLLQDVSWKLMPGQRIGLVGANGCGKSTLLRCLCGIRRVDAGRVLIAPKVELGYLEQTAVSGSTATVWKEARSRMTALVEAEAALEEAQHLADTGAPDALLKLQAATEAFEAAGGYDADKRIANVLSGLGFTTEQWHKPTSEFSGGWQMRIALARLLLSPAGQSSTAGGGSGMLLLDEPTNHLDSAAIKWLANFLKTSGGTMVIVSHDEALLDGACDGILEVRGKKVHQYSGGYSRFLTQRTEREQQAAALAAAQQIEIARLEEFVTRFGAKASKASQAQSKVKLLEKLKAEAVEIPAPASAEGPGDAKKVTLKLPRAPACYTEVLALKGAAVGWGNPPGAAPEPTAAAAADAAPSTSQRQPLISDVNLVIKRGDRVLVLGPNGAGKSTLLKAMAGRLPLWAGTRKVGEGARIAVFSQDLAQDLPQEQTGLEYVTAVARAEDPGVTLEKIRQSLGALGLQGSMVNQKIGVLSGGEKARVALAAFALVPCNVLLLDEASNHLDAQTIQVLTGALQEFQGAIVAITHNRAFANSLLPTRVLRVAGGRAVLSENLDGLTDKDFEHPAGKSSSSSSNGNGSSSNGNGNGASSNGNGSGASGTASRKRAPTSSMSASVSQSSVDLPSAASSSKGAAAAAAAAPAAPAPAKKQAARKRTTLSFSEQTEYKKLCKDMERLTKQRDTLSAKVAKLAAEGKDYKTLEASSKELAVVGNTLDEMEVRWLELAELAGDL